MTLEARIGAPRGAALEEASCLFCPPGTPAKELFADPPFRVVRCRGCGLVFVTPRVAAADIAAVYGETYWRSPRARDFGFADYRADAPLWERTYRLRVKGLRGFAEPPGRVLDVGCAAGHFLAVMREQGFDVHGVELSGEMAAEAGRRLGAERVHVGTLEQAPFPERHFDVVSFWDVVEHLPQPIRALRRARELLKEDGLLVVETQNVESAFARLMGRRWHHFKQVEHLWHFSPATVARLLDAAGFTPVRLTSRRAGKHVSLAFIVERSGRVHPALPRLLAPLARLRAAPYVNLFDELVVLGRPR